VGLFLCHIFCCVGCQFHTGYNSLFCQDCFVIFTVMKLTRKEEIVIVAAKLFKEKGYSAVSMRDIAQQMDIKAASLYNHIKSKQEILSSLVLHVAEKFTNSTQTITSQDGTALQRLKKLIEVHIDITVHHADAIAALNNDWMHLDGQDLLDFIAMRDQYEENFRSIIKQGIQEQQIKAKEPEVILFSILSTLRTLYLWNEKRGKLEVNVLKKELVSVLISGIV
jgi:AcrR family transcriptional regulator